MLGDITDGTPQQQSGLSVSDYATLSAWYALMKSQGRLPGIRVPSGPLQGALASRLLVPDPSLSDPNDYRVAPSNIVLLDMQSSGGSLDFSGIAAQAAMAYSDTVMGAFNDVLSFGGALGLGLLEQPFVWIGAAAFAMYLIVKNPERARAGYAKGKAYVQRWRA
jgi:hypothetical protein